MEQQLIDQVVVFGLFDSTIISTSFSAERTTVRDSTIQQGNHHNGDAGRSTTPHVFNLWSPMRPSVMESGMSSFSSPNIPILFPIDTYIFYGLSLISNRLAAISKRDFSTSRFGG